MEPGPIHDALKPLQWLIGKWESVEARGYYPTIKPFTYCEEINFTSIGQPVLNYSSASWHPISLKPMHLESGFLRIKPGSHQVAFMVSHNFGCTSMEEGVVNDQQVQMKSTCVSRMAFAKEPRVLQIWRSYRLVDKGTTKLEMEIQMKTSSNPLDKHLKVLYKKC